MILVLSLLACSDTPDPVEGPPPDFPEGEEFISADLVYEQLEAGAVFQLLDARPTVDFEEEHIVGALSTPFYEIEEHEPTLPADVWYIAYCACPHSESGIVADYLRSAGHETVAILDEGFLYWVDQGYPTESGTE